MRPTNSALAALDSQRGLKLKLRRCVKVSRSAGIERDGQHRGHDHPEGLGVGQRLEQPSFLRLQGEHRNERDGDHQQREEARAADFLDRRDDDFLVVAAAAGALPHLQFLVRLLHHHDGRVHHGADGDGDAAERHDVGRDAHAAERNERDQHRDGNGDHRDERAGNVPQEQQHDQRHRDDHLDDGGSSACRSSCG